jgi:hypothetical protein
MMTKRLAELSDISDSLMAVPKDTILPPVDEQRMNGK